FASVINNNVNQILKTFASISLVFAWATLIFSFYGMNVTIPFQNNKLHLVLIMAITILTCIVMLILFWRKKLL
ncbi:magnesium transporter CorA family protein, partial [bacterium]|nr:magnesium transporter CorA family protein [bacterium]